MQRRERQEMCWSFSLDHPVRPLQHGLRDGHADLLRSLQVDEQLELRRLHDGKIGGARSLPDPGDGAGRIAPRHVGFLRVAHEATVEDKRCGGIYGWQSSLEREIYDPCRVYVH